MTFSVGVLVYESPIEAQLGPCLERAMRDRYGANPKADAHLSAQHELRYRNETTSRGVRRMAARIRAGKPEGRRHRFDFAATLSLKVGRKTRAARIDVECDGAAYHADQARDDARDTKIHLEGWRVLRFTGSRIYSETDACAAEVVAELDRLVDVVIRGAYDRDPDYVRRYLERGRIKPRLRAPDEEPASDEEALKLAQQFLAKLRAG